MSLLRQVPCCFDYDNNRKKVCWLLTLDCNLKCKHCSVNSGYSSHHHEPTLEEILRKEKEFKEYDITDIVFSGGEPTLRSDLAEIIRHYHLRGFSVSIATNGTSITPRTAKSLRLAGLNKATVSLDGANPTTHDAFRGQANAFQRTINGITMLVRNGIEVTLNTTLHDAMFNQLEDLISLSLSLSIAKLSFIFPMTCGRFLMNRQSFTMVLGSKSHIVNMIRAIASESRNQLQLLVLDPQCESEECPSKNTIFGMNELGYLGECLFKPCRQTLRTNISHRLEAVLHDKSAF